MPLRGPATGAASPAGPTTGPATGPQSRRPGPYTSAVHRSAPYRSGHPVRTAGGRGGATAAQALLLAAGLTGLGALFDAPTGGGIHARAVCFVVGCLLAAGWVRFAELRLVLVAPPLLYGAMAVMISLGHRSVPPTGLSRHALDMLTALVMGAPVLFLATVGTMAVSGIRILRR